jgi:hypothetical protein
VCVMSAPHPHLHLYLPDPFTKQPRRSLASPGTRETRADRTSRKVLNGAFALIEAQATVSACLEAYRATSDAWWYEQAQRAFDWFIGWNDLGLELYQPETGGCADGLHVDRVNENQGAESTLAFRLSLAEMRSAQNMVTSFKEPIVIEK